MICNECDGVIQPNDATWPNYPCRCREVEGTPHQWEVHDKSHPCSYNGPGCPICDGGLSICTVCHLLEGGLTTECSGKGSWDKSDEVYAGRLDFRGGEWTEKTSIHSPRYFSEDRIEGS